MVAVRAVLIRGPAVLSVSGGATSAMMWRRVLDAHGGRLPADVRPVFCNTGKEFPATLDFLHECETRWECPIVWVERAPGDTFREVDYATASRDGEPFEQLIRERRYLPNPSVRFCTSALKVEVSQRWARAQGWETWTDVVGLRADEPARVAKRRASNATDEERQVVCPLADAGITREDVDRWWASQPFRLDLKRGESNCDLCFMKGWQLRQRIVADHPAVSEWWERMEREGIPGRQSRFHGTAPSYARIAEAARRQLPLAIDLDDSLPCACTD